MSDELVRPGRECRKCGENRRMEMATSGSAIDGHLTICKPCKQADWRRRVTPAQKEARRAAARRRAPKNPRLKFGRGLARAMREGHEAALSFILGDSHASPECVLWRGCIESNGYGSKSYRDDEGRIHRLLAHRLVFELAFGPIPRGQTVHHKCATRACVNPAHLELATNRENVGEMFARRAYEAHIAELRAALAEHSPDHPLLAFSIGDAA